MLYVYIDEEGKILSGPCTATMPAEYMPYPGTWAVYEPLLHDPKKTVEVAVSEIEQVCMNRLAAITSGTKLPLYQMKMQEAERFLATGESVLVDSEDEAKLIIAKHREMLEAVKAVDTLRMKSKADLLAGADIDTVLSYTINSL